jgi:flavorubredoxin
LINNIVRAVVLYDSKFGNTKKLALGISRGLEAGGIHVDCSFIQDFELSELKNYDIIAVGGPTHMHGASKPLKAFLSKLRVYKINNKKGFIFETKVDHRLAGSAGKRIRRDLKKMKVKLIHPIITGIVNGREGPLRDSTLTKLEEIGLEIALKLRQRSMN